MDFFESIGAIDIHRTKLVKEEDIELWLEDYALENGFDDSDPLYEENRKKVKEFLYELGLYIPDKRYTIEEIEEMVIKEIPIPTTNDPEIHKDIRDRRLERQIQLLKEFQLQGLYKMPLEDEPLEKEDEEELKTFSKSIVGGKALRRKFWRKQQNDPKKR